MSTATPLRTELPTVPPTVGRVETGVDYELLLDCVHCGLCTAACPTYLETGHEGASPRGRIYLMRQVIDGALGLDRAVESHLDTCLNCRACETACPSGVQYGRLIEPFREYLEHADPGRTTRALTKLQRWMLLHIFPSRLRTRLALAPARLSQWGGLDAMLVRSGLLKLLPKSLRTMHGMLPPLARHRGRLPECLAPVGKQRARVGLFLGCVADAIYPETNHATARVLQANGCEVLIPRAQGCCGALHYHNAEEATARELALANARLFNSLEVDAVITNAAGCGAMLKDYAHLLAQHDGADAAARFQAKVRDISEFLDQLGLVEPPFAVNHTVAYHDACHLRHAQQVAAAPRRLLERILGLTLVPLEESEICCGAAGSYNLVQPEMASRLGDRKAAHVRATAAEAVATGNVGCLMQITRHLTASGVAVLHPVDLLDAAYTGRKVAGLGGGKGQAESKAR